MRWPWQKREKRDSGGDFSDAVVRLIEAQAAGTAADASSTAAVEAASGALSRAFASARVEVEGPPHVLEAVTGHFLAQAGRDLIRSGDSMHIIDVDRGGRVSLLPCSSWHFEGDAHPDTWTVRATVYGPSTSTTRHLPYAGVVFVTWGSTPGQPYVGTGPLSWAHTTARLQSEAERSLADEAAGPIAQLLSIPDDGGAGGDDDPLAEIKADLRTARGKALLLETVAAGWGDGRSAALQTDWRPMRLGPNPPESMATIRQDAFAAVLAATGTPPSLFVDSDGTSQREAVRRWHLNTVLPLARLLQDELSEKLEGDVRLTCDGIPARPGRARSGVPEARCRGRIRERGAGYLGVAVVKGASLVVEPKAGELADVLSEALETDVQFSFRSTWAHDLVGRTNSFSKLVAAGMDPRQARLVSGLDEV